VSVDKNFFCGCMDPWIGLRKKICVCVCARAHMHAPLSFFNPVLSFGIIFVYILGKLAVEIIKGARS